MTDPDGMACSGCRFDPNINLETGQPINPDYQEQHPGDAPKPEFTPREIGDGHWNKGESAIAGACCGVLDISSRIQNVPKWLWFADTFDQEIPILDVITDGITLYYLLQDVKHSEVQTKGGKQRVWPDQYGYPPDVKKVDWKKSNSKLADEKSNSLDPPDTKRGPGTPNNKAAKWFRDHRPKN
jgi:hypothetical protein